MIQAFRCIGVGLAAATLCLAGCGGGDLSKESFNEVKVGMSQEEVEALLGSAAKSSEVGGTLTMGWENGDAKAVVVFRNGKVKSKQADSLE